MASRQETISAIRFGYGFTPEQDGPRGPEDLLASIPLGVADIGDLGGEPLADRAARFHRYAKLRGGERTDSVRKEMRQIHKGIIRLFRQDCVRRVLKPVASRHGFYERLAYFWADHFSVGARAVFGRALVGRFEADAIRPHIGGSFRDMLRASSLHPAMLFFLDQNKSFGPDSKAGKKRKRGLNENLAREIIELHTLGVGADYSQRDVRQFAELLTGLGFRRRDGVQTFRKNLAEPGAETVLGRTYGGGTASQTDIERALDDLAAHPATARHIAWKLARHFVSDNPSDGLVSHIERAFRRTDGDLPSVYAALLEHDESWSTFGEKVKQPFDFIVSSLRAIGPTEETRRLILNVEDGRLNAFRMLRRLSQGVYFPPGPQGFAEEAEVWITPQGLAGRIDWASRLGRHAERRRDPRDVLATALGSLASAETTFAATQAAEKWEGVALVLASPEFNRR